MASVHGTHAHAHTPLVPRPLPNELQLKSRAPNAAPATVPIAKTSTVELQSCSQCRRPFVARLYKTCDSCRGKSREKRQIKKQREQAQRKVLLAQARARIAAAGPRRAEDDFWSGAAGDSDTDVEMEEPRLQHAAAMSKKRKAPSDDRPERQYQTEQALLDALRGEMRETKPPSCANFAGSFTVVMDPDVPSHERVKKVVAALKAIPQAKLGIRILQENKPSCGGHARTYRCCCSPPPPAPAVVATSQSPLSSQAQVSSSGATLKRTQSGTLQPFLKPKPRPVAKNSGCGGTITVYAVTDLSHPLAAMGLKGQRVIVQVEHPGRDVSRDFQW